MIVAQPFERGGSARTKALSRLSALAVLATVLGLALPGAAAHAQCSDTVIAEIVALDQPWFWNRYGAMQPHGMMYALKRDVVPQSHNDASCDTPGRLSPGRVRLRSDKRPRPLILRVNEGQCLEVRFTNLLDPVFADEEQVRERDASFHAVGLELVQTIRDDGADVGNNGAAGDGVVGPGQSVTYKYYAGNEGTYVAHNMGSPFGGEGDAGTISMGLFGAVNVEPAGSEWYRSQVTEKDLSFARTDPGTGYPVIDYNKRYTATEDCRRPGTPILRMLDTATNQIVHSDLTAIITGANGGNFGAGYLDSTAVHPNRKEPFREFSIIFHDELAAVQAFPQFYDEELEFTLHSVRDAFAINYGTGGIGAEILANRLGVGPVHDCVECLYEEFFLTAWAVGDPAMVVDRPANFPCTSDDLRDGVACTPQPGPKASVAFYPDDPSNVYHSYMNDHVKFRNSHAGSDDHHVFHLHAHQWTRSPKNPDSLYLDSQSIGQGSSFTYEIAYEGSGNRNKTVGDSIFHCHLYPHFAQGMWSMWRVHDVLETGTPLDDKGRPELLSRALPDGEIDRGTPIPALVPIPNQPLAPLPAGVWIAGGNVVTEDPAVLAQRLAQGQDRANPGWPFYVPGEAGHRPPHPPLDTLIDGGLPRHVGTGGGVAVSHEDRYDFSKHLVSFPAAEVPEQGDALEQLAMAFHADANGYSTPFPNGSAGTGTFEVNGADPVRGAPYADPCIEDDGTPVTNLRTYKAADIQLDVVFNKAGWHFPQQRIITLEQDVQDTLSGQRPPEPFFFRTNSGECIEYHMTNLVPNEYIVDDFQVRTPTDILGQHIHLVKFDVTSSDGGGNGFNYEDGTFSPEEVQERIEAIRAANNCPAGLVGNGTNGYTYFECPEAEPHPVFGTGPDANCNGLPDYLGAQTTVQRWWADPVLTDNDGDQTLRTVFTHDHFGPSTHQQVGLYAGLVVEPAGSSWFHSETGAPLGTRPDGGPTTWQAVIDTANPADSYREFLLEFGDFQHAYKDNGSGDRCPHPDLGYIDFANAINPPGRNSNVPHFIFEKPQFCPTEDGTSTLPVPCPEAIAADDPGMGVVNYRNEPVALRVRNPTANAQASHNVGAEGPGDLSFAYQTRTDREDARFNTLPFAPHAGPYPALTKGLYAGDPYTPLMRVYEEDSVKIRVLTGAHEEEHNFTVHGLNWLAEPADPNSGYRNSLMTAISEYFDLEVGPMPSQVPGSGKVLDYLYKPSAASEWQWSGMWGLIRVYQGAQLSGTNRLQTTESNTDGQVDPGKLGGVFEKAPTTETEPSPLPSETEPAVANATAGPTAPTPTADKDVACPAGAQRRIFDLTAVAAYEVLDEKTLLYNWRTTSVTELPDPAHPSPGSSANNGPLHDPTAILFVYTEDLIYPPVKNARPQLKPGAPVEPLILRANAGDCIAVTLRNDIPKGYADLDGWSGMPMLVEHFNANDVDPSLDVSLHPQLVFHDMAQSDGSNVGLNPAQYQKQSVSPGEKITYFWYAGRLDFSGTTAQFEPIEYGAVGLTSADPIKHTNKGAVGMLIVEPADSDWIVSDTVVYNFNEERRTRGTAWIHPKGGKPFREMALIFQNDVNLRYEDGEAVRSMAVNEDATESGQKGFNYRTEPVWFRMGYKPETSPGATRLLTNYDKVLTNAFIGGQDPVTPLLTVPRGSDTRFRVVHPGGHTQNHVFTIHGHNWQFNPYVNASTAIGDNPLSENVGARFGVGPTTHFDAVLNRGAGGVNGVTGDYLYHDYAPWYFVNGLWGLMRVE